MILKAVQQQMIIIGVNCAEGLYLSERLHLPSSGCLAVDYYTEEQRQYEEGI